MEAAGLTRFPKCWNRHRERSAAIHGPRGSALHPLGGVVAAHSENAKRFSDLAMTGGYAESGTALARLRGFAWGKPDFAGFGGV